MSNPGQWFCAKETCRWSSVDGPTQKPATCPKCESDSISPLPDLRCPGCDCRYFSHRWEDIQGVKENHYWEGEPCPNPDGKHSKVPTQPLYLTQDEALTDGLWEKWYDTKRACYRSGHNLHRPIWYCAAHSCGWVWIRETGNTCCPKCKSEDIFVDEDLECEYCKVGQYGPNQTEYGHSYRAGDKCPECKPSFNCALVPKHPRQLSRDPAQ